MPELPIVSGRDAVKAFQRPGFFMDRQRSSRVVMKKVTPTGEVGDGHEAGHFIVPAFAGEVFGATERLRGGHTEVFAKALVSGEQPAAPKKVSGDGVSLQIAGVGLKRSDGGATDAEGVEALVPERLLVRALRECASPSPREADGPFAHLAPGEMRHGLNRSRVRSALSAARRLPLVSSG